MSTAIPVPVSILTGFLGAGKTTLLNDLLKHPEMNDTAVIINEFGDVGIDHLLVETADDNVFEMASGCLCCTIRGDLVDTLCDLMARRQKGTIKTFNKVVIETTGLADPAPVLHTIMNHPVLLEHYRLEGVITVVDTVNGSATLDVHEEAVKQVAVADRLVLTKADLLVGKQGEEKLFAIIARLKKLNRAARMLEVTTGEATPQNLFNTGIYDPETKTANVARWLAADAYDNTGHNHGHDPNRHDDHIESFSITSDKAISQWNLDLFLELLRGYHGPNLLRVKGIIKLEEDLQKPLVIHGVQHIFHPPFQLDKWPDDDHRSRMVFITRDIKKAQLEDLFKAFTDPVRGGAEAFRDDTLSLRGND
ncbi:Metal chaperone, involved in Zn homeostasis [hydrothermal vent metagenome]|uniref:Metal chaperone, involved in Zn homeostasis n=1 Tax=hydrothermal vent metagenome TaxID=652676 RepID=A0A3B0RI97_9ZZZZ